MSPIAKIITVCGFALGFLAFAAALFGASREIASQVFACGFVLAAIGITLGFIGTPKEAIQSISSTGMKIAAIGFGLAAIPTAIGAFFFNKTDSELAIFFWPGFALVIAGLAIHAWSVINKRS